MVMERTRWLESLVIILGAGVSMALSAHFASARFFFVYPAEPAAASATGSGMSPGASTVAAQASPPVVYINSYKEVPTYYMQYQRSGGMLSVTMNQAGLSNPAVT